jgi:hypothetical protein
MKNSNASTNNTNKVIDMNTMTVNNMRRIQNMTLDMFVTMYDKIGLPTQSYAHEKYRSMQRNFNYWFMDLTEHNRKKVLDYLDDYYAKDSKKDNQLFLGQFIR